MSNTARFAFIVLLFACLITSQTNASQLGTYVGIQLGKSNTNAKNLTMSNVAPDLNRVAEEIPGSIINIGNMPFTIDAVTIHSVDVTSFIPQKDDCVYAGRLFIGYQFYSNMAVELGYTRFRNTKLSYDAASNTNTTFTLDGVPVSAMLTMNSDRTDTIQQDVADIVFKGILPVKNSIDLYAKIGAALLYNRVQTEITVNNIENIDMMMLDQPVSYSASKNTRSTKVYPSIGLGLDFFFSQNAAFEVSFNRIVGSYSSNRDPVDFWSAGFLYYIKGIKALS